MCIFQEMSSENVNVKDQVGGGKGKHGLVARLLDQSPYPGFGALSSDWSFTLPDDVDSVSGYENIIQTLHKLIEDILERCCCWNDARWVGSLCEFTFYAKR